MGTDVAEWEDGRVEIADYLVALDSDGVLLAEAAECAGLTASVPACPGWQVRDLLRHQAYVHGWAARHVRDCLPEIIDEAAEADVLSDGPPDDDLLAAYRAGHAALVHTLRTADPDVPCATFMRGAPSPLAFWARRQAHETAIHRYDAQSAGSDGPPDPARAFAPAFAADGLDELIMGFTPRNRRLRGNAWSLTVRPTDAADRWNVQPGPSRTEVARSDAAADCVLSGSAAGLYALLWNRCTASEAGIEVTGDESVLASWNATARVIWS